METVYDLIIVGGGPGGLSAAIYAARYNLNTLMIVKERGGLVTKTHLIENYPGYESLSGFELMDKIEAHAKKYGVEIVDDIVESSNKENDVFSLITLNSKKTYLSKAVVMATGSSRRKLGVKGEVELDGKGVSYCATCDGMFFREKNVIIVGGSDSAAKEALMLSEHCNKVYIVYRGTKLRAEPINFDRVLKKDNIEIIYSTNIIEIVGENKVEKVIFDNVYNGSNEFSIDGIFIEIGQIPASNLAKDLGAELNGKGEILVTKEMRTNVFGLYAIGDVTDFAFKQAIVSASHGSISAWSCYLDLEK